MDEDTIGSTDAMNEGEERPVVISYATVGELRSILTDRRIEHLRTLLASKAAESIPLS